MMVTADNRGRPNDIGIAESRNGNLSVNGSYIFFINLLIETVFCFGIGAFISVFELCRADTVSKPVTINIIMYCESKQMIEAIENV